MGLSLQQESFGDVDIRNIDDWNRAFLHKNIWDIKHKEDSLRVKWTNSHYPEGQLVWDCQPAVDSSWYLKRLCRVRDLFSSDTTVVGQMLVVRLNEQVKQVTSGCKGMVGKFSDMRSFDHVVV